MNVVVNSRVKTLGLVEKLHVIMGQCRVGIQSYLRNGRPWWCQRDFRNIQRLRLLRERITRDVSPQCIVDVNCCLVFHFWIKILTFELFKHIDMQRFDVLGDL